MNDYINRVSGRWLLSKHTVGGLLSVILLICGGGTAFADSLTNAPGSASTDAGIGTVDWTNPGGATTGPGGGDTARASMPAGQCSYYLVATNFNFNVPGGSVIDGIVVEFQRVAQASEVLDAAVRIVKNGAIGAADRSAGSWPTNQVFSSYGGAGDIWGESWTLGDINSSGFGVAIAATNTTTHNAFAKVNYIRITVHYTVIDGDLDGMLDDYERFFGLDITTNDAALDSDNDGLNNLAEFTASTHPFVADTDHDGFADGADNAPLSRAYAALGDPTWIDGDTLDLAYAFPDWISQVFKTGGDWQTNAPTSWHVESSDTNDVGLYMEVNRGIITNNAVLRMSLFDHAGASLYVDLLNSNMVMVATNIFGNILGGTGSASNFVGGIPFETHGDAVGLFLRRGSGEITIYDCMLYIDKDGDGLDSDQELQLGTSDNDSDSDDDGLSDYAEVFTYGTNPLQVDSDGDGMPDGWEIQYFGNQSQTAAGDYDGDGVNNLTEYLQGRDPTKGAVPDTNGQINLRVFTVLE